MSLKTLGEPGFQKELEQIIHKYSIDDESNTPDFILASYVRHCLHAFNDAVRKRDGWCGITNLSYHTPSEAQLTQDFADRLEDNA
jgi:hypothetical protein